MHTQRIVNALRLASLSLVIGALTGCGLALEPRYYKESSVRDDATLASDGNTVTSDGSVVVNDGNVVSSDSGVVEPEDGAVVIADSGVAHEDSGVVVSNDGNFVPRDSGVGHMDSATVRDSGVMDTGVRVDSGVRPDSGSGLGDSAVTTNDGASPCADGQLFCGGTCVRQDESNCGGCGMICAATHVCRMGACGSCGSGLMACRDGSGNRCCLASCPISGMLMCAAIE